MEKKTKKIEKNEADEKTLNIFFTKTYGHEKFLKNYKDKKIVFNDICIAIGDVIGNITNLAKKNKVPNDQAEFAIYAIEQMLLHDLELLAATAKSRSRKK